jgi:hypothetical protein
MVDEDLLLYAITICYSFTQLRAPQVFAIVANTVNGSTNRFSTVDNVKTWAFSIDLMKGSARVET